MSLGPLDKLGLSRLWILAAAVGGILLLGDLNSRMGTARQLEHDAEVLNTETALLETQQVQLQTALAAAGSDAQVEEWARAQARMVRDGEELVIPLPAAGVVTPTPEAAPTGEPLPSAWRVWWTLLFGG
jgi:outer membrane murein-binding lipoprotein Lpp